MKGVGTAVVLAVALLSGSADAGGTVTSGGKTRTASGATVNGRTLGPPQQHCDVRVVRGFGGIRHFGSSTTVEGPSFLIVDALPLEAQVLLDGRPFGSATQLMAHAFPLAPGRHTVGVVAPGFKPYSVQFAADPSFSTRLRIALSPE
jgi:hypothetical protein